MNVTAAAVEARESFRDARGHGAIVFDPARLPQAQASGLFPGDGATPVAGSGRGAAWFVQGAYGQGVLRHYRRGGAAAHITRDRYLWLGESRVRSFAEFRLLQSLRRQGLPVPAPVLAGYWRSGPCYRAGILVERIAGARSLADSLASPPDASAWQAVGRMLARFHAAGLDHADLNAHNILFDAGGRPWLIDLDRGLRRSGVGPWAKANLRRLARSLAKLSGGDTSWHAGYQALLRAYGDAGP